MIRFFTEEISFQLKSKLKVKNWIKQTISDEGFLIGDINYIFCDDKYLIEINIDYLNHDTYTDIITFNNSENPKKIEGDIFISIDRVKENAERIQIDFNDEILRVIIHGVLHLCGYKDKKSNEIELMRNKENYYLNLIN